MMTNWFEPFLKRRREQRAEEQRRQRIIERLEATMKPDPRYAYNRAAQLPPERRERFLRAVRGII